MESNQDAIYHKLNTRKLGLYMYQIRLVLRQRRSRPLQNGLLFLGSFISSLCLLLVLSIGLKIYHSNWYTNNLCAIKMHKLKFVACLIIRPLCLTVKCGQFNLNPLWDKTKIVSLKINLDILKVEHWTQTVAERHAQYFTKTYDRICQTKMGAIF